MCDDGLRLRLTIQFLSDLLKSEEVAGPQPVTQLQVADHGLNVALPHRIPLVEGILGRGLGKTFHRRGLLFQGVIARC